MFPYAYTPIYPYSSLYILVGGLPKAVQNDPDFMRIDRFLMNRPQNRDWELLFNLPEAENRAGSHPRSGLGWRPHKRAAFSKTHATVVVTIRGYATSRKAEHLKIRKYKNLNISNLSEKSENLKSPGPNGPAQMARAKWPRPNGPGHKWAQMGPMGPNGPKWTQMGPNGPKSVDPWSEC